MVSGRSTNIHVFVVGTLDVLKRAFEAAGVEFIDENWTGGTTSEVWKGKAPEISRSGSE